MKTARREGSAGLPSDETTIVDGVWMLEPGEDAIVVQRVGEVLSSEAQADAFRPELESLQSRIDGVSPA